MKYELNDRKSFILRLIIDEYIDTGEPIGSRTVSKKPELKLSSATIRNEMADLEELGYLVQPHASAGRVPSDKGYRFYVDKLMSKEQPSMHDIKSIRDALGLHVNEMGELTKQVAAIMSELTRYVSVVSTPDVKKNIIKAVQVVPVDLYKALIVVVTNADIAKNVMVKLPKSINPGDLVTVSNVLNEKLKGLTVQQIDLKLITDIQKIISCDRICDNVLIAILNGVAECINKVEQSDICLTGATNILDYPEFGDVLKAKELFNVFDEKELLIELLNNKPNENNEINIKIGAENKLDGIKDCSLVTATYSVSGIVVGTIAIIGPTRMKYSKVISLVDYVKKRINCRITKILGNEE